MRLTALAVLLAVALSAAPLRPVDEAGYQKVVAAGKGQVVLVNFWATYCAPCRKEMPALAALAKRLGPKGLRLVVISADEPEQEKAAQAFIDKQAIPGGSYIRKAKDDDAFIRAIDAKWSGALPATFLYDRTGKKVKSYIGELDVSELERAIAKLL